VIQFTKEVPDIRIQNPVHLFPGYPHPDRIQRIMHTTFRAKAIAKTKKHLFVNLHKQLDHRMLDYFVLQCGYTNRTLFPIVFRYVGPLGGFGSVPAFVDPVV